MLNTIFRSKTTIWIAILYLAILGWWAYLQAHHLQNTNAAYLFNWSYGLIGLSGFGAAVWLSYRKWGGHRSVIGRGLIFLGLGLLGQWFGLQVWTYYNVIAKVQVPYPSWADAGYFALIPAYALAALMFARAAGAKFTLRTWTGKIQVLIVPVVALALAYGLFLRGIGLDFANPLKLFFDVGYPLGEIIPPTIALLTLTLTRSLLGGSMKNRIRYLIFAFLLQFATEYAFIYASGSNLYVNGGWNDLMYATSYAIMAIGIVSFGGHE